MSKVVFGMAVVVIACSVSFVNIGEADTEGTESATTEAAVEAATPEKGETTLSDIDGFREAKWGFTKEQVRALIPAETKVKEAKRFYALFY